MLTKPIINDRDIIKCLQDAYGLQVNRIAFLPLGADFNTVVYRVTNSDNKDYFLKLRRGKFVDTTVTIPHYLANLGIKQIVSPLPTQTGQLWTQLNSFKLILYPYLEGKDGVEAQLSDQQWIDLGSTMRKIHTAHTPESMVKDLPQEAFLLPWNQKVKTFLTHIESKSFEEPTAKKMALFLNEKRELIIKLINRAEELGYSLQKQSLPYVLCHADIHGWNLLVDAKNALYVIDWDTLICAPKERDLMFIGAGISPTGRAAHEEEPLFYEGYGDTKNNQDAIAYYRYARIIKDIGEYCELIFLSDEGGEDRIQSLEYMQSNFLPNGTIERAQKSDPTWITT